MSLIWDYRFDLLNGLLWTLKISLYSALIALAFSFAGGLGRIAPLRALRWLAVSYIELFRGTSAVAQLFFFFYVLPYFGLSLSPTFCASLGLGMCFGAYGSEIVRSCLNQVPVGQYEAAHALNFSRIQTLRLVVMPEALIAMVPLFGNLLVELIKATSLVSLITIPELAFQANSIINKTYSATGILLFTLVIYLIVAWVVMQMVKRLEYSLNCGRRSG
ncbi:ectoine/hydroxyectoine ABC transporter permease subunit EhuC [Klebsiella pneumoniae]|uniref:ectoine/hydroxyectoine ABC transporter permease subunit EhuC n=1 Tax=Klebsiella pneumoniae TaxID=573 RepID=UPI000DE71EBE|nr:ectoine/hydroxyectoine ABC transporter permease subunit EhuC [Klebsiella pneumoniae]SSF82387.1 cystine ABC transporter [Klebsiella pneumoniae]HDZ1694942.1 ectoine/hydroxyectoine ABC transporter permease subunit EhuC [Klebsiella pneumoniae]